MEKSVENVYEVAIYFGLRAEAHIFSHVVNIYIMAHDVCSHAHLRLQVTVLVILSNTSNGTAYSDFRYSV